MREFSLAMNELFNYTIYIYMSINFIKKNVLLFTLYDDMKYWYDMVLKYEMGLSGQKWDIWL